MRVAPWQTLSPRLLAVFLVSAMLAPGLAVALLVESQHCEEGHDALEGVTFPTIVDEHGISSAHLGF